MVFLALDLILGKLDRSHPLWGLAIKNGISESTLDWFTQNPIEIDICGINLYPMFSQKCLKRDARGVRIRMPYASAEIIDRLSRMYFLRYRLPIMITETATRGTVQRRVLWLSESVEAIKRVRAEGIPLIGYTWWPMFSLVAWAYRQGTREPGAYLEKMGLWDLVAEENGGLRRSETPLVDKIYDACRIRQRADRPNRRRSGQGKRQGGASGVKPDARVVRGRSREYV